MAAGERAAGALGAAHKAFRGQVAALAGAIDAGRSPAVPGDDLGPILAALAGLGDEQVLRVMGRERIGARDERPRRARWRGRRAGGPD